MRKGLTLVEILTVVAILTIFVAIIANAIGRATAKPQVVNVQQTGTLEATGARTITKVPYDQIEDFLSKVPANVKITSVVPIYRGSGNTFDISHYL